MQNKKLKILIIIFLSVLGLLALKIYLPKLRPKVSPYNEKIKNIKTDNIGKIEISQKGVSLTLNKEQSGWNLQGKKVDAEKIEDLINAVFVSPNSELIAETDLRHKELELTDELASKLKVDDKLTLLIGKSDISGSFIRFDDDNSIFLLKNLTSSQISTDLQDWYDKTIVKIEEKDIKKITFTKPREVFSILKQDDKWKMEGSNKEVNKDNLQQILTTLGVFKANSLAVTNKLSIYPNTAGLKLTIEKSDGTIILEFYKGKDDYLVKRKPEEENFLVSEFQVKDFLISRKDIES